MLSRRQFLPCLVAPLALPFLKPPDKQSVISSDQPRVLPLESKTVGDRALIWPDRSHCELPMLAHDWELTYHQDVRKIWHGNQCWWEGGKPRGTFKAKCIEGSPALWERLGALRQGFWLQWSSDDGSVQSYRICDITCRAWGSAGQDPTWDKFLRVWIHFDTAEYEEGKPLLRPFIHEQQEPIA
jgi:hypothetical protein